MEKPKSYFDQVWDYSMPLPGTELTIRGHSRGSERSCFEIPELKVYFDCGIHRHGIAKFLFITHGHSDHSGQLPTFVSGLRANSLDPPEMYAPAEVVNLFQDYLDASYKLKRSFANIKGTYKIRGAKPGQIIPMNNGYFARVYNLYHDIPTRGYGICQTRKKLRSDLLGHTGKEIAALSKSGIVVSEEVTHSIFAYICDTTIQVFEHNPELLQYKYIMVECTFFCDDSSIVMREHIHWKELKPIVEANPDVKFILIHFSMRYSWEEIENFFVKQNMKNIIVWTN